MLDGLVREALETDRPRLVSAIGAVPAAVRHLGLSNRTRLVIADRQTIPERSIGLQHWPRMVAKGAEWSRRSSLTSRSSASVSS